MKKPIQEGEELFQYIPQRPPFVMVSKIYEKGEDYLISGFDIVEGNLMVQKGYFQEGGLVENIAQTAALLAGTRFNEHGKKTPLGFIAGINHLHIGALPKLNDRIHTKVKLIRDLMNIQIFEGETFNAEDQWIAGCELRIFIKANDPETLQSNAKR